MTAMSVEAVETQGDRDLVTIRSAWSILAQGSARAAESLVTLSTGARSELVRVQAATAVLDRVGLGRVEGVVVSVDDIRGREDGALETGRESAAAILATRIRAMNSGAPLPGAHTAQGALEQAGVVLGDLVDAESVCEACGVIGEACGC